MATLVLLMLTAVPAAASAPATINFSYSGAVQTWIVPAGVRSATFDVSGAAGGTGGGLRNYGAAAGPGGRTIATLTVTPGEVLQVNVGGRGGAGGRGTGPYSANGGWNGGGSGAYSYNTSLGILGGGGGGSSEVRRGANSLIVGPGGGGGGAGISDFLYAYNGGAGGGGGTPTGVLGSSGTGQTSGGGGLGGSTGPGPGGLGRSGGDNGGSGGKGFGGGGGSACCSGIGGGGGGGAGYFGGGGGAGGGTHIALIEGGGGGGGGGGSAFGPPGSNFSIGTYLFDGYVSVTYTVDDDLALVGMPSDITVDATSPSGAVVTYIPPTASDAGGGAVVRCLPVSGSTFPIGTTPVTCKAIDSDDTNSPVSATFNVTVRNTATLKVCKVAGPGVDVGTLFSFTADNGTTFYVTAGPAPGGYCIVTPGSYLVGSQVTLRETNIPVLDEVSAITVAPAGRIVGSPNLGTGTVTVTVGTGVTEVTYTNQAQTGEGYLEICAAGNSNLTETFYVASVPNNLTVNVPPRTCSPAIKLAAGARSVAEYPQEGERLQSCQASPSNRLLSCDLPQRQASVAIVRGDISTQAILTFNNQTT